MYFGDSTLCNYGIGSAWFANSVLSMEQGRTSFCAVCPSFLSKIGCADRSHACKYSTAFNNEVYGAGATSTTSALETVHAPLETNKPDSIRMPASEGPRVTGVQESKGPRVQGSGGPRVPRVQGSFEMRLGSTPVRGFTVLLFELGLVLA